ncbi:putative membrane protein [Flavobacterium sp. PL11]|uniref:hypothetical protein n=1 Tax=Flavobacterium sp. PL11 TaxID=3071717 RepID=UPI002E0B2FEB|nr:putative membrane protein [Flavobacterium sp. PL11]
MNYLKFTQYVYLVFGAYFVYDGITKLNNPALGGSPWLSFIIAAVAVFMFFFRRKFAKKFEDRNKKS